MPTQAALAKTAIPGILLTLLLAGCGTLPERDGLVTSSDGAPQHNIDIAAIPDAEPRIEPLSPYGNPATYSVNGKRYHVKDSSTDFQQHGIASWYGTKFHGRKTSSGEAYDMFAMTAAHKTLPLPTWLEVTNDDNQKRIIVKVNDRGPFVGDRIIDLSYAAAVKLGVVATGTAKVTIKAIDPVQYLAGKNLREPVPAAVATTLAARPAAGTVATVNTTPQPELTPAAMSLPASPPPATTSVTTVTAEPTPAASDKHPGINGFYLQIAAFSELSNAEQLRQRLLPLDSGDIQINSGLKSGRALYRVRIGPLVSLTEAGRIAARITSLGLGEPRLMLD